MTAEQAHNLSPGTLPGTTTETSAGVAAGTPTHVPAGAPSGASPDVPVDTLPSTPAGVIISLDPVARVEGHLRAELTLQNGVTSEARVCGGMYRGFETLLIGRDPFDAPRLTQRICSSCSTAHATASCLALEQAAGAQIPSAGRLVRNLILAADFLQAHLLHFYQMVLPDYVPGLATVLNTGRQAPSSARSLDRAAREQSPKALEICAVCHEMAALFGGRMPHPLTIVTGGATQKPERNRILEYAAKLRQVRHFVEEKYVPLVYALAGRHKNLSTEDGLRNLLCLGAFPLDTGSKKTLFAPGAYMDGKELPFDATLIHEDIRYAWFTPAPNSAQTNRSAANGASTSPRPPDKVDPDKADAYTFIKAASYAGKPMEVGALARMWINDVTLSGIGNSLAAKHLGLRVRYFRELGQEVAFSVMGRHIAKAEEALFMLDALEGWLQEVIADGEPLKHVVLPIEGEGVGWTESPHGSVAHYLRLDKGKISAYVILSPAMWNCAPRNGNGLRGPLEQALIGSGVPDPARPIQAGRIIRSFALCPGCGTQ